MANRPFDAQSRFERTSLFEVEAALSWTEPMAMR